LNFTEKGAKDTLLDVVSIDVPNDGFDSAAAGIKNTNLNTLAQARLSFHELAFCYGT